MSILNFPNDYPRITTMESGHLSLELTDRISYDNFHEYAENLLSTIGGSVEEKHDAIVMCIWDVVINQHQYRLVYDDYPCGGFLESFSTASDNELTRIKEMLLED